MIMIGNKVTPRSASDKTDDWPYWMVWDGYLNVTSEVFDSLQISRKPGAVFTDRASAEYVCEAYNAWMAA